MDEIAQQEFDLARPARLGAALALAFLSAAEAAILSAPVTLYLGRPARQYGEFDGIASFGEMVVVAVVLALFVFIAMFAFIVTRRRTAGWITPLSWTLCAALAVVLITLPLVRAQVAIQWAVGLSATVLAIGLGRVFSVAWAAKSED